MDGKFQKIISLLKSNNFHYSETWVRECVEHFIELDPAVSDGQLWEQVKEQWLLSDLRETAVPGLPPNLKDQAKMILPGKYVVQVETMVDSGRSRYSQLQELQKDTGENVRATKRMGEDDIPEKRCITMTITDGVQHIFALEYELIPDLKLNNPEQLPGFKMLITGPVICRKGVMMLSQRNVTVLGGEVNTLVESNSYQALLMRSLGINPTDSAQPIVTEGANPANAQPMVTQGVNPAQPMGSLGITPANRGRPMGSLNSTISRPPTRPLMDSGQGTSRTYSPPLQPSRLPQIPLSADSGYPQTRSVQPSLDDFMDEDDDFLLNIPLDNPAPTRDVSSYQQVPGSSTSAADDLIGVEDLFNDDFDISNIPDVPYDKNSSLKRPSASSGQNDFKRPCNYVEPFMDDDWDHNPFRDDVFDENPFRDPKPSTSKAVNSRAASQRARKTKPRSESRDISSSQNSAPSQTETKRKKVPPSSTITLSQYNQSAFKQPSSSQSNGSSTKTSSKQSTLTNLMLSQQEPMEVKLERRIISAEPFVYLHQICTQELKYDAMYKVKAIILTLKTKISVQGDNFSLLAKICDGSYSIDVNFASDILERMLGFSPSEMIVMLKEKKRNSALAEKLAVGFKQTQQKLISLNCIFCIQFFKDLSTPRVVALEDISFSHLYMLRQRQS